MNFLPHMKYARAAFSTIRASSAPLQLMVLLRIIDHSLSVRRSPPLQYRSSTWPFSR
ncbi:hypothetical protein [Nostoc sp. DSM 114159]